jgi:phosphohistidine phosphatase
MAKTILLVRHSKPESRTGLRDFDRGLNQQGISDSRKMAGFLKKSGLIPEILLTSSARRALETAGIFGEILEVDEKNIFSESKLYYSSPQTILEEITCQSDEISCVMVLAHNPGITELSRLLSHGEISFMTNTQVAVFFFETEKWSKTEELRPAGFKSFLADDCD